MSGRPETWSHGTHSSYCKGCRCDACREAHRVHMRRWRVGHTKSDPKPRNEIDLAFWSPPTEGGVPDRRLRR